MKLILTVFALLISTLLVTPAPAEPSPDQSPATADSTPASKPPRLHQPAPPSIDTGYIGAEFIWNFSTVGIDAEWKNRKGYLLRGGFLNYNEFQGILPKDESLPYERYLVYDLGVGRDVRTGILEAGASVGLGYAKGLIRGKQIRVDSGGCFSFCFGDDITSYYDSLSIATFVPTLTLKFGLDWGGIALRWAPHIYYARREWFYNLPLTVEFRYLYF